MSRVSWKVNCGCSFVVACSSSFERKCSQVCPSVCVCPNGRSQVDRLPRSLSLTCDSTPAVNFSFRRALLLQDQRVDHCIKYDMANDTRTSMSFI